ncbi:MAG: class I SAM-dependent methyltransferase [Candidatus Hodarchaeales archaeon]
MDYATYCNLKMDAVESLLSKDKSILDVGCGDSSIFGHLLCHDRLKRHGFTELYGIDRNPKSDDTRIVKGDAMNLPFKDGEFQQVICLDVVEHIANYRRVLKELVRVASERVVIIVPTTRSKRFHRFIDFIRRIAGVDCFLLEGHYYEFFENQIAEEVQLMCRGIKRSRFYKLNYPIPFSNLFFRTGFICSGLYIFDKK